MKKINWIWAVVTFILGIIIIYFIQFGWDILPRENYIFNFDTLISFIGIVVSLFAIIVVYRNTNKQIKNQNIQMNRPFLTVNEIVPKDFKDVESFGTHCSKAKKVIESFSDINEENKDEYIILLDKCVFDNISIKLQNIGYGVASNIKFYNLESNNIVGSMSQNQPKLFPTIELAKGAKREVFFQFVSYFDKDSDEKIGI